MPQPTVNFRPNHDDPDTLLILTIEDGVKTILLDADDAVAVCQELGRVLHLFDLLDETDDTGKET